MQVVGYKKFTAKSGLPTAYLMVTDSFPASDVQRFGAVGMNIQQIWIGDPEVQKLLTPELVGKKIKLSYVVDSYNRPQVDKVTIL